MKFTDLTEEQIQKIKSTYADKSNEPWEKRAIKLGNELGVSERTIRKWVSEKFKLKEKPDVEPEQYKKAKKRKLDKSKKRFIISWCQNNTPIHEEFFNNLKVYAKHIDASIHIILGRYKNPTSVFQDKDEEFWDKAILPYQDANRHNIHKYLSIMSDVKIQPTATNVMSGLQGMSRSNSCIFGSPKVQMEMIPVLGGDKPKMMLTTGAVSLSNYVDGKSGKKGEFHHTMGCIVVELKNNETFFVRQVTADDKTGSFSDLFYRVENGKVSRLDKIAGIVLGDLHYGQHDQKIIDSTLDYLNKVKTQHVVIHDAYNGTAINHHESKDSFMQYAKEVDGTNSLKKEIDLMLDGLKSFEKFQNVIIVKSNHDEFLDRWLKNEDWKKQPTAKNSPEYMEYSSVLLKQYAKDKYNVKGVIPHLINERFPKFITLNRNSSYKIKGIEISQHGDIASNGSRGNLNSFRTLSTKIIVGHFHTPGRKDGALAVGTSTHLRIGYNNAGASSWLQSHVIIHEDGKMQHMNFDNGEYTTLKQ